jgi:hypothetical protein
MHVQVDLSRMGAPLLLPQGPGVSAQEVGDLSERARSVFVDAPLLLQKECRSGDRCSCAPSKG